MDIKNGKLSEPSRFPTRPQYQPLRLNNSRRSSVDIFQASLGNCAQYRRVVFAKHRCEIQGCTELFKTTNEYEQHLQKVHVNPGTQAIQSATGQYQHHLQKVQWTQGRRPSSLLQVSTSTTYRKYTWTQRLQAIQYTTGQCSATNRSPGEPRDAGHPVGYSCVNEAPILDRFHSHIA